MSPFLDLLPIRVALNERNDCAVASVAIASGIPYEKVREAYRKAGRRARCGAWTYTTEKALKLLGVQVKQATEKYLRKGGKTLRTLERVLDPNKRYLIRVSGHMVAGINGRIEDTERASLRRVIEVQEVLDFLPE